MKKRNNKEYIALLVLCIGTLLVGCNKSNDSSSIISSNEPTSIETSSDNTSSDELISSEQTKIEYNITYVTNGGVNNENNKNSFTNETSTFDLYSPSNDDEFAFAGWYTTVDFIQDSRINVIEQGTAEDIVLYAKWVKVTDCLDLELNSDGTGYDLIKCTSDIIDIKIPREYNAKPITNIGREAFINHQSLKSIEIPNTIISIGNKAFLGCTSLKSIIIPNSVTTIVRDAFKGCNSLIVYCERSSKPISWDDSWHNSIGPVMWNYGGRNGTTDEGLNWALTKDNEVTISGKDRAVKVVTIPSTIEGYKVTTICENAFRGFNKLEHIDIPDSVNSIEKFAFSTCPSLKNIIISNNVISIGSSIFIGCNSLIIYCEAPAKISSWNRYWNKDNVPVIWSFGGKSGTNEEKIDWVLLSDKTITICGAAKEITNVTIPSTIEGYPVTKIFKSAFRNCASLESVSIPNSVISIEEKSFEYCNSLKDVSVSNNLTTIGERAFNGCISLTSIFIPMSVESMGGEVFKDCIALTIYVENSLIPTTWDSEWNSSNRPVVLDFKNSNK